MNDGPEAGYDLLCEPRGDEEMRSLRSAVIYDLICELLGDERMRSLINAVIYNSVSTGFALQKVFHASGMCTTR